LDPMNYVLSVEDMTLPTDTRFLHVLQGSDATGKMAEAGYVTSTTGTAFDGAVFGNVAVFFPEKANTTVTKTTFTVPSTITQFVVTGLKANGSYNIGTQTGAKGITVTLTPGGTGNVADSAGLLKVTI